MGKYIDAMLKLVAAGQSAHAAVVHACCFLHLAHMHLVPAAYCSIRREQNTKYTKSVLAQTHRSS